MGTYYSISDLAHEFGLTLRTLRFYEAKGLLRPARVGSRRVYRESDRKRLEQITTWTSQGFTLAEIGDALREGGFTTNQLATQLVHLKERHKEIVEAIEELERRL